ncbi:uncharacterized protein LOC120008414 isoform X1 [Tripterygium wilfordii]|uniref:uncharacterized protein LOC120008414 isoform X1 n=1 Tax=Tripterygium wilfordii TaxID=458696 RepID=UPI0018F7F2DC|nr:uncharacterized protein LOC120008414 isoform X1 [Tripterygium wilfordii]XP_038714647.1 uncharacterized protein LOC120008414 isoform X1 [Tripterygium wilfordii]XP_038714648.1 uncharacterized protein LOC120008414 isoform X1 [Tripterygium wilfordii]XP_038714649.1 uncharacterized protein LOC120008414 isoform X1 [Tripterygium wilfordii]
MMSDTNPTLPAMSLSSDPFSLQLTTTKFDGSNYLLWAWLMEMAISAKGKFKYISCDPPPCDSEEFKEWKSDNSLVMTWLWNSMEMSVSSNITFLNTAKGIWDALREKYFLKRRFSLLYDLYDRLFSLKQGERSVAEYSDIFMSLVRELEIYHPKTDDVEVLKQQREEFFVCKFLHGLNPNFHNIRNQILAAGDATGSIPSLDDVFAQVLRAEYLLQVPTSVVSEEGTTYARVRGGNRKQGRYSANRRYS